MRPAPEPTIHFTYIKAARSGARIDVAESLRRFGTVAFGIEMMCRNIHRFSSSIDVGVWMAIVPEVYRDQIMPLLQATLDIHRGLQLTNDLVRAYVDDLNREIGSKLQAMTP